MAILAMTTHYPCNLQTMVGAEKDPASGM